MGQFIKERLKSYCLSSAGSLPESNTPLLLEDLISYSFQVARGMEFLASRKVKYLPVCIRIYEHEYGVGWITFFFFFMFSVHSSWPCCQKHPAVQQQCGEDLWFWLGPRRIQRPRLCAQGRCKYSAIKKSKFMVNNVKKGSNVCNECVLPWRHGYHWSGWHLNQSSTKSSPLRVTCGRMEFCSGRSSHLVKTTLFTYIT